MAEKSEMRVAELLCSKLCHDLISPIGAINNGLEFLQEDSGDMLDEASKLIGISARQAADRLAYFRMALGAGGSDDEVDFDTVLDLIDQLAVEKKIETAWIGTETYVHAKINKMSGKLILNLALIAFDCLPRGGRMEIALENNPKNNTKSPDLTVIISGEKCNLRDDVKIGLDSKISADSLTVQNVLAYYCMNLANVCQKTLNHHDKSPSLIEFRVS
jgi:histidine phosphotransferase ChpT